MKKLITCAAALATTAFMSAGVADAYPPYPPTAATVTVSDSTPAPGGSVTVTVSGCTEGEAVTFQLEGDTAVVICGADGTAAGTLDVPATAGTFNGTATLGSDGEVLAFSVVVTAPTATIPRTGTDSTQTTGMVALLFVGLGGALYAGTRVRRRDDADAAI